MDLTLPILQMRKLRLGEVKRPSQALYWVTGELRLGPGSVCLQNQCFLLLLFCFTISTSIALLPFRHGFLCCFTVREVEIWISCDSPLMRH